MKKGKKEAGAAGDERQEREEEGSSDSEARHAKEKGPEGKKGDIIEISSEDDSQETQEAVGRSEEEVPDLAGRHMRRATFAWERYPGPTIAFYVPDTTTRMDLVDCWKTMHAFTGQVRLKQIGQSEEFQVVTASAEGPSLHRYHRR